MMHSVSANACAQSEVGTEVAQSQHRTVNVADHETDVSYR